MVYYIVLFYISQGTGGVYGVLQSYMLHPQGTGGVYVVLHRSMLHPSVYLWCIRCAIFFYVTSPRVLLVNMVYYIVLCYVHQDTGGIYGVIQRSMLHPSG